jgi:hypothetical protein
MSLAPGYKTKTNTASCIQGYQERKETITMPAKKAAKKAAKPAKKAAKKAAKKK